MRTALTTFLILTILAIANVGLAIAETTPEYISVIEIQVDGLIGATGISILEDTLAKEEGVAEVTGDAEKGIIAVIPDPTTGWVSLYDLAERINGTRQYSVIKMDVVAVGRIAKFYTDYYRGKVYQYTGDRYKLYIGHDYFLLTKNEKLEKLVRSGYQVARVTGTVTAFSDRVPIMQIQEFAKPTEIEETVLSEDEPKVSPDRMSSVAIEVDGFICATCVITLEEALKVEEGVGAVTADLESGTVIVTPETDGPPVKLVDLVRRVNGTREYTVRKMTVVATGRVAKLPVKYHEADVHPHSHDRHKLQVGDTYFILSESGKLDELLKSGYDRVRVVGTVSNFSNRVPIMLIGHFEKPDRRPTPVTYTDALEAMRASLPEERDVMEKEKHAHIDSVRVYVDGFICSTCGDTLREDLLEEEGVASINTDTDLGLIEVVPAVDKEFDLHDIWQRINAMREYKVLKMDVVASGEVIELSIDYHAGTSHPHPHKRYKLGAGKYTGFVLTENDVLDRLLRSGDRMVTVIGTVTAFRGRIPILEIRDYQKLEERPEWLELTPL